MSIEQLPKRVIVSELISGRYRPGVRPVSWDLRREGSDVVRTSTGEVLTLFSSGGQSTPAPGWELLVTQRDTVNGTNGYHWTLYGLKGDGRRSEHPKV